MQGRMVGNPGRKLLGHVVKSHSLMGVEVVVIKTVSQEGKGHNQYFAGGPGNQDSILGVLTTRPSKKSQEQRATLV